MQENDLCAHLLNIDVVEFLNGLLDLVLVGLDIDDEDERVVVLDLLHRGLGRQRVLDDRECVQLAAGRSRFAHISEFQISCLFTQID